MIERNEMIIFILLILVIIGLITFYIWKTGLLTQEHFDEVKDLLDEINARDAKIEQYEKTIKSKKTKLEQENDEIARLNEEINDLQNSLSLTIVQKNAKISELEMQLEIKNNLLIKEGKKLKEKENNRIASIGTISSKQRKINNLESELIKLKEIHKQEIINKDRTIEFLKTHRRAPSMEELKAYEFQQKEVEKRIKNK